MWDGYPARLYWAHVEASAIGRWATQATAEQGLPGGATASPGLRSPADVAALLALAAREAGSLPRVPETAAGGPHAVSFPAAGAARAQALAQAASNALRGSRGDLARAKAALYGELGQAFYLRGFVAQVVGGDKRYVAADGSLRREQIVGRALTYLGALQATAQRSWLDVLPDSATKDYPVEPSMQQAVRSDRSAAIVCMATIGYLAQQTEVIGHREVLNRARSAVTIVDEEGRSRFTSPRFVRRYWDRLGELAPDFKQGFLPTEENGTPAIRIINLGGRWTEADAARFDAVIDQVSQELGVSTSSRASQVALESVRNNWRRDRDGGQYLARIHREGRSDLQARLDHQYRQSAREWIADGLRRVGQPGKAGGHAGEPGGDHRESLPGCGREARPETSPGGQVGQPPGSLPGHEFMQGVPSDRSALVAFGDAIEARTVEDLDRAGAETSGSRIRCACTMLA